MMRVERLTQPSVEPVTLEELKNHCRITFEDDDVYLEGLGKAARGLLEKELSRSFITCEWAVYYDYLGGRTVDTDLPIATATEVTGFYLYRGGVEVEYTGYQFSPGAPGRVAPPWGSYYPFTIGELDSIKIVFSAGYGDDADSVPEVLKHAIKLLVGGWYENREEITFGQSYQLTTGVQRLIKSESWRGW